MNRFRWGRTLAALTLALLIYSGAAQALPLRPLAGREPGILVLLRQVFSFIWSGSGVEIAYGGAPSGDNGGQLDPSGTTSNGDNGGQLDPDG